MGSRRHVLAALGIGALVAGFDPGARAWASDGPGVQALPPLDGTVHLDDPTRRQDSQDAGSLSDPAAARGAAAGLSH